MSGRDWLRPCPAPASRGGWRACRRLQLQSSARELSSGLVRYVSPACEAWEDIRAAQRRTLYCLPGGKPLSATHPWRVRCMLRAAPLGAATTSSTSSSSGCGGGVLCPPGQLPAGPPPLRPLVEAMESCAVRQVRSRRGRAAAGAVRVVRVQPGRWRLGGNGFRREEGRVVEAIRASPGLNRRQRKQLNSCESRPEQEMKETVGFARVQAWRFGHGGMKQSLHLRR